jgi:hypothetical protein
MAIPTAHRFQLSEGQSAVGSSPAGAPGTGIGRCGRHAMYYGSTDPMSGRTCPRQRHKAGGASVMVHQARETRGMRSNGVGRRVTALAGGAAVVAMVSITAGCGTSGNQAPSTTTTPTTTTSLPATTAPATPPTEKSINPTGGNLFTPPIQAPAAPTEPPGVHHAHH